MRRLKNIIFILILVFALALVGNVSYHSIAADSGFDTSYDSGGWDSGSSSWDSGSSSSGSGDMSGGDFIIFIVIVIIIILVVVSSKKSNTTGPTINTQKLDLLPFDDTSIKKVIPNFNMNQFLNDRYNDFVNIQVSWMNFDYDNLRLKLTDELYNQYYMQLMSLESQNRKNVMSDFRLNSSRIISFNCNDDIATIKLELDVSFYDYITENSKIVRGNKYKKVNMVYNLTFVSRISNNLTECPSCGATISNASSQVCQYCNSVISSISKDWVLSKKEVKRQR